MSLPIRYANKLLAAARRGARLLDRRSPGWYRQSVVSLGRLKLADCSECVLGQIGGRSLSSYNDEVERLGLAHDGEGQRRYGFIIPSGVAEPGPDYGARRREAWAVLTEAWKHEIRLRRSA